MEPYTLLVIARTQSLAKRLRDVLDGEQVLVRWVPSTTQALDLDLRPSLLVLALPSSGGARCVARLKRQYDVPILALAQEGQAVPDQVDVSLSRPSGVDQLAELIETMLVRHSPHMVRAAGMSLDTKARRLQMNGALYPLRPLACRILAFLMRRPGKVVSRDELFSRVWRTDDGDSTRALDVHIAYLRRKLEADPRDPKLIVTERGVGYRLQPPG